MRAFDKRSSLNPFSRLGGLTAVGGLHALLAIVLLVATGAREVVTAPAPLQVRLLPLQDRRPEAPTPLQLPKLAAPPRVLVPLPEVPVAPLPESPAIAVAATPAAEPAPAALAAGSAAAAVSEVAPSPRPAQEPVMVEQVAYARFEPPQYPALSRRLGEQGLVVLRVLIDEEGRPVDVQLHRSSGYARLDQAALEAVRRARFLPYREGERARAATALVPVRFELT